ncbi:type IV toxin-antitoxin system AbiEi family antitoxin domain-containing protein [Nocardioides sp. TRM66260-LWL]|uniref:type IV toxin-antitoxin system AbiEi family antitoxin domain-containing protein n=1 Tax=Nocardioides sp. TRM66260-LWL TaxID=2874478 RepID=UPI001CC64495|nr:type IV toxin-antitoxin system AbiEi family antitoxin domain-containing protein [Nocardioides sp. TRM66260-LWL]MBZ5736249.1 type IV toxin-antitoxin system AbiEi family antitoxin domain-containing protein [Nocardioides sp. TRM66260-LWL]
MIEHLCDEHGIFLRRDAVRAGIDDLALQRRLRTGEIVRIRHGVYCLGPRWREATSAERHLALSRGVMRLYPNDVCLSHTSAALLQGAPAWGIDLDAVHITDLDQTGQRRRAKVHHHRGSCRVGDLTRVDGHWLTAPTRTVLDVAGLVPRDVAVVVADDFLRRSLTTFPELQAGLAQRTDWPEHLRASTSLGLARVGADSVGETRLRLLLHDLGVTSIVLQHPIRDDSGDPFAFVDLYLPELGVLVEFDGRIKYTNHRRPGESIGECVLREKRREDRIREVSGLPVLRVTWQDLEDPIGLLRRIHQLARRAA